MTSFFLQQADFLDVQCGYLLVFLGMIGYLLWRGKDSKRPWKWFALYGVISGFLEWLNVFAIPLGSNPRLSLLKALLITLSYACLAEFGRERLRDGGARMPGPWIHAVFFCFALPTAFLDIQALPSALALSMGVSGTILAAIALIHAPAGGRSSIQTLRGAGIVMAAHAVMVAIVPAAPFWPASIINTMSFAAITGLTVVIPRTIVLAVLCAILRQHYRGTLRDRGIGMVGATAGETCFALVMVAILAAGWVGTGIAGMRGAEEVRGQLGHETDIITSAIDPMRLAGLTLTSADLTVADHQRLREQLVAVAAASPDVRRITVTIEREGRVYFVTDSLPKTLSASVQPGELYGDHLPEIHTVNVTGVRTINGPYTDRSGTFLSGFGAIRDPVTAEVRGVLGVDWDFTRYSLAISRNRLIPLSLMIIACIAVLAYQLYRQRDREVARRLAASERSMRLAQAISRVGNWTRDLQTGRSEWSAEMFTIFGVDPARGTPTVEEQRALVSERDWERELGAEERAERDGAGFEVDFRIVRPDGEVRYLASRGEPVRDAHGRVTSVAGIVQDLTLRHEAQAQVEMLNKRMEFILSAARTGLDIIDSRYNVRYVDPGWQKVYGDPAGRKCHDYFMGRATPCDGCGIRRALEDNAVSVTEEILPKEGNRPIQVTTIPFQSGEGEWLVAEVNVDITERKRIEEGNARLAALVESSEDAIVGLGMDRTITVWNQGAQRVYGYSAAEIIGRQTSMLIPPDREDEAKAMRERLERGERIERYETTRRRKDGALINVALTLSMIRDPEGKPIGMASVARDITADKAIQAQLIRAQRLESLGTLAGGIAHQFNNINAVIQGYLQLLEMGETQGRALTYVQEALKGVQRAVNITDRLLGFTNVSRNEGETSRLEDVSRSILPLIEEEYKKAGVLLRDELVTTPAVKAGTSMVCFIITGLLSNALHAVLDMQERTVSIRTGVLPGYCFLEVSDTGCGMALEDVRRVFTPFFTTKGEWAPEGSPQAKNRGIGLTLAVSQATAAAQGGRIEVQSVPGQGSAFRLLLPVAPTNTAGA